MNHELQEHLELLKDCPDEDFHLKNREWISIHDHLPPKGMKFLFSYEYGMGLGEWGCGYEPLNGKREFTHEGYILILWPSEINEGRPCLTFKEEDLKEFNMYWIPLPAPPPRPCGVPPSRADEEALYIYNYLKDKYPDSSKAHGDIILNALCGALRQLIASNGEYKKSEFMIRKILEKLWIALYSL